MNSPALPFKIALETALRACLPLKAAMGGTVRIYTEVPQNAPLPYVVLGADEITGDHDPCGDQHEIVSTVQWWAKEVAGEPGSLVVRKMGCAIIGAMLAELPIVGHSTDLWEMETPETYGTDPDGSSRGRMAARYETSALD